MEKRIILDGAGCFWKSFGSLSKPASSRSVFITEKALKLSRPDVGSSQNRTCGFVNSCGFERKKKRKKVN